MNTKRIVRWSIVLFLLLALPGLTAALAQGQEPAAKQLPAVTEVGESATSIPWIDNEHNPNNSVNDVNQVGWIPEFDGDLALGGSINSAGDVDYWVISWDDDDGYSYCSQCTLETSLPILIDIDAVSIGSPLDSKICLYSDDGYELGCNDDTDTHDSMLFFNLELNRKYYLKVVNFTGQGGSNYKYQILLSSPLLISAAAGGLGTGNVAGIPFQSGDILAWSKHWGYATGLSQEKWVMLFDLSDLNVKGNVTNLAAGWRNSDTLLLGFAANATLPGISGTVTPWEVVTFDPTRVGPFTQGTFQRWWNGKNQGLTLAAEKLDAIDWPVWNGTTRLRVSTTGKATVSANPTGTLKLADEDVGLWSVVNGKWTLDFDGSLARWGISGKDVIAMSYAEYFVPFYRMAPAAPNSPTGYSGKNYYLVLPGTATLVSYTDGETINATQKDIIGMIEATDDSFGYLEYYTFLSWRGPDHGWNYNIDAIDYLSSAWRNQ